MKALLPLAGLGKRMYPLGVNTPKCLLPILNKPLLRWTLEALKLNGIHEVVAVINNGEFGQKIKTYIESLGWSDFTFQFAFQDEQKGTADVVQAAKDFFTVQEEFLFLHGDDLYGPQNIAQIINTPGLAVTGQTVTDPEKWGIFQTNEQHQLMRVVEKPTAEVGKLANIGCMKLKGKVFELFRQLQPSVRGEYELTDTLNLLVKESPIQVLEAKDYWLPIGYPWHLLAATEFLAPQIESEIEGTVEENVVIKGKVVLPKSSTIKSGTYIEGNVIVGENSVIGPNAYLRESVVIGNNCKIGFSVEVKNSVFGNDTHVPHLSYVGDSVLADNVNFAGTSITANFRHDTKTIQTPVKGEMVDTGRLKLGTIIGENVKLGIGTTIYPGRKIWPNKTTLPDQIVDKDIVE